MKKNVFIETPRLYLLPPCLEDFHDLYELQSDLNVMEYIDKGIRDKVTVLDNLIKAIEHQKKHGFSLGSVFDKASQRFVGRAGLVHVAFNDENDVEVAYAFHQIFWNLGYASELAQALLNWGLSHLAHHNLVAIVHKQNQKSRGVLEKIGMQVGEQDGDKVYYRISQQKT